MEKTIVVFQNDNHGFRSGVLIFETVAEKYGLKKFQIIGCEKLLADITIDNCLHGIAMCKLNLAIEKYNSESP